MAGNDDGDAVHAVSPAHCTDGSWIRNGARDVFVRARFSIWNVSQGVPDPFLERSARSVDRNREAVSDAGEVFLELSSQGRQMRVLGWHQRRLEAPAEDFEL